ncbi:hypothetical protein CYLTODRAFT_51271 [Cylindrobasidium torrendii FP15055 ss-10]|uniref:Uncharacterized protein n=1 Tax=Cylindrobasidium torrendii FP15055 ss-10 TaxID=1314674 RepID=A0A0D7B6J3_9AGAR|nr:hypothetical protein CYLTODRAFT_51271 [Cylindrobasidium torrendii FP15055 ss-10]
MYARTFVLAIFAALVSVVASHETNAERMARGMNPLAPRRLFSPAHVARTVPSSVSCPSNAVSGYICLRGSGGNLLGYLGNDGVTCGKSPQKFEYPSGCDVKTAIKLYGTVRFYPLTHFLDPDILLQNSYVGAYARSVVGKVITDIQNLFASLRARTNGAAYTSTKIVPSIRTFPLLRSPVSPC